LTGFGVVAGAIVAVLAATAGPAFSHHGPDSMYRTPLASWSCPSLSAPSSNGGFCRTDNSTLTIYMESTLDQTSKNTLLVMLEQRYQPTDLTVEYPSSPVYSGSGETDIIYQMSDFQIPSNLVGVAWCNDAASSQTCDQHYVRIRPGWYTHEVSCHETGHAVGLTHPTEANPPSAADDVEYSCMRNNSPAGSTLGLHNRQQINAQY